MIIKLKYLNSKKTQTTEKMDQMQTIATKMSSEESDDENEELNFNQINYNKIMYDALTAYQQGDLSETIKQ